MMCDWPMVEQIGFLVPLLFLIYLLTLIFLYLKFSPGALVFWPLYLYFALNILTTIKEVNESKNWECFPFVMGYQLLIVLSYGVGIFCGLTHLKEKITLIASNGRSSP
jgi:4-hydroxybenzoate polyprenyltransferase